MQHSLVDTLVVTDDAEHWIDPRPFSEPLSVVAGEDHECLIQHAALFERPDEMFDGGVELSDTAALQRLQCLALPPWSPAAVKIPPMVAEICL